MFSPGCTFVTLLSQLCLWDVEQPDTTLSFHPSLLMISAWGCFPFVTKSKLALQIARQPMNPSNEALRQGRDFI